MSPPWENTMWMNKTMNTFIPSHLISDVLKISSSRLVTQTCVKIYIAVTSISRAMIKANYSAPKNAIVHSSNLKKRDKNNTIIVRIFLIMFDYNYSKSYD